MMQIVFHLSSWWQALLKKIVKQFPRSGTHAIFAYLYCIYIDQRNFLTCYEKILDFKCLFCPKLYSRFILFNCWNLGAMSPVQILYICPCKNMALYQGFSPLFVFICLVDSMELKWNEFVSFLKSRFSYFKWPLRCLVIWIMDKKWFVFQKISILKT